MDLCQVSQSILALFGAKWSLMDVDGRYKNICHCGLVATISGNILPLGVISIAAILVEFYLLGGIGNLKSDKNGISPNGHY
jgi:hypothetical protein